MNLDGLKSATCSPQARHHFTLADQVNQLVSASEADPDLGASWRERWRCAACPAPTPATGSSSMSDVNGPYTLGHESLVPR